MGGGGQYDRKSEKIKKKKPPPVLSWDCHQLKKARLLIFGGQSLFGGNPLGGHWEFYCFSLGAV